MIGSVVNQNKSLSAAGKTPKDTTYRHASASKYSAQVSSSKRGAKKDQGSKGAMEFKKSGNKQQGSLAGLINSSGTVLQVDGAGYDATSAKTARYSKSMSRSNLNLIKNFNVNSKPYSIMNNYSSLTTKNSSSERMKSLVKNNMMF